MKRRPEITPVGDFTPADIEAAEVLLQLPRLSIILESRCGFPSWPVKRRRSLGGSMQSFLLVRRGITGSGEVVRKCETEGSPVAKAEALSPATPLSFSPSSESDEKPKRALKIKFPLKRKREEWLVIVDELTRDRDLLKGEIENMRRGCDSLRAFNLELKAKASVVSCLENGKVGTGNQDADQMASSPEFRVAHSNTGPSSLPDLNVSAEEMVGMDYSGSFHLNLANKTFSRTMAAQARHRRMQICRLKKLQCRQ